MNEIDQNDHLLDAKEAAIYLNMKKKTSWMTVLRWAKLGKIKSGKVGRLPRFRKQDLDDATFR